MIRVVVWALVLVVISAIYRVILNTWLLHRLLTLQDEHAEHLSSSKDNRARWDFTIKHAELKGLFEQAGIADRRFTSMEAVGYGHVQPRHISMFDNMSTLDVEIQVHVINAIHEANGVFRKRRKDALNPLLWIDDLINLPASIVTYLGVKKGSVWARLSNVIVWACTVVGFLIELPAFSDLQAAISGWFVELRHFLGF